MSEALPTETSGSEPPHWTSIGWRTHAQDVCIHGRRLRYLDYGEGPPLVLIHGLGGAWQTWLENIPTLANEHRVVAVDLPGFGHSEVLAPPASMAMHVTALVGLMDHLEIERATLVGHSMGGLVCLGMAESHPERIDKLVLVNAGGAPLSRRRLAAIVLGFRAFFLAFGRPAVMRAVARRPRMRRILFAGFIGDPRTMSPQLAAESVPLITAPGFLGAVTAAQQAVGRVPPEAVRCPVLVLWGDKDRILPLHSAHKLAHDLPDATLEVLPGVGHCPMFESPRVFNETVLNFTRNHN